MKIYDISIPLSITTPVYPGNIGVSIEMHHKMPEHQTHLSKITMGSHSGTHIDAPSHAVLSAPSLSDIPIDTFVGPCRVFDFSQDNGESVLKDALQAKQVKKGERILLKTRNSVRGFETFYDDYVYLDGDTADWLAEIGVLLVGIDALSIKKRGSSDQRPHTSLLSKNIPIIEGLNLKEVPEGSYMLYCLPLKFVDIEGAPARAILIES